MERIATILARLAVAAVLIPLGALGQTLPNGGAVSGQILLAAQRDNFTFSANTGEGVLLRVGATSGNLFPQITIYDPQGSEVGVSTACAVNPVHARSFSAPSSGTYTVAISACYSAPNGTGHYNLYLTRAPGANEGGSLNDVGLPNPGTIELGDLDSFTFSANAGDAVLLRVGATSGNLSPAITIYNPQGTEVGVATSCVGNPVHARSFIVPSSGTYTVVISACSSAPIGTGNYNLYLTRAPGANEGGSLNDGLPRIDQIDLGDLDAYTFTAISGDSVQTRVQRTGATSPSPRFSLYSPTGALLNESPCGSGGVSSLTNNITINGTYTVVVYDCTSTGNNGTGPYTITVTGANGIPPSTDHADVPVPPWATAILAILLGTCIYRRSRTA